MHVIHTIYVFHLIISSPLIAWIIINFICLFSHFQVSLTSINISSAKNLHSKLQTHTYHWWQYNWNHFFHNLTHIDSQKCHSYWYKLDHMIHQWGIHWNLKAIVCFSCTIPHTSWYDGEYYLDYWSTAYTTRSFKTRNLWQTVM